MEDIDDLLLSRSTPFTFNTLHDLLSACGLNADLQSYHHNFTLFAPPDDVFERLREKTSFDLVQDIEKLRSLLSFHIATIRLTQAEIRSLWEQDQSLTTHTLDMETISGHPLHITQVEPLTIEHASVLMADMATDNGVIHVIDQVLWPPGLNEESFHGVAPFHTSA